MLSAVESIIVLQGLPYVTGLVWATNLSKNMCAGTVGVYTLIDEPVL